MKVLIIDVDSKIPNIALKKIEAYHLSRGDEVIWNFPLIADRVDKAYVSCIFDWNKDKCKQWEGIAEIGGTGYDIEKRLPPEIEQTKVRINIGFTTRGCIRSCPFCVVPRKEGKIRIVGDIYDIWDGKSKDVVLLDNNILALPEHFKLICAQIRREKLRVDFTQGLDHRLLNDEVMRELVTIRHKEYRFAFDDIRYESSVRNAISLLKKYGINRSLWYVLVGFNSSFEEDLYRVELLRSLGQDVFIQRYRSCLNDKKYIALARWANQHKIFRCMSFQDFLKRTVTKETKSESLF